MTPRIDEKMTGSVKIGVYIRYQFSAVFWRRMATENGVAFSDFNFVYSINPHVDTCL